MFIYSLKLFGSNWVKALKYCLYYLVIWGICFALLLPALFEFKDIISSNFNAMDVAGSLSGVFQGSVGVGMHNVLIAAESILFEAFAANVGLVVYGLIVIFIILPFLINVGKYAFSSMLYSYMTSKNKIGFFSALVKTLNKSFLYALCRTFYNLIVLAAIFFSIYGLSTIADAFFIAYLLPVCTFVVLVLFFTLNQLTVLGWMPALIVFDCNIFSAYKKGLKAVRRHFWATFGATSVNFILFWLIVMIFGLYGMVVLIPLMTTFLIVYNMTIFFSSQGMRFYYNENNILTPKKLEEVDNINKTAYIL
ncbi:MAG: hypothetical protein J6K39_00750 [Clostridia bacterium]|nr:hypothetical protein [Clostridia bacterium]